MTLLTARKRGPYSANTAYADAVLQAGAISVDQDAYTAGLDRIYDVKGLANIHIETENTDASNAFTYKIEKARKEYTTLASLIDADFDQNIKANTNVPIAVSVRVVAFPPAPPTV